MRIAVVYELKETRISSGMMFIINFSGVLSYLTLIICMWEPFIFLIFLNTFIRLCILLRHKVLWLLLYSKIIEVNCFNRAEGTKRKILHSNIKVKQVKLKYDEFIFYPHRCKSFNLFQVRNNLSIRTRTAVEDLPKADLTRITCPKNYLHVFTVI